MVKRLARKALIIRNGIRKLYSQYIGVCNDNAFGYKGRYSIVASNSALKQENIFIDDYCVVQSQTNFISNKGKLIVKKYSVISSGCIIVPGSHRLTVGVPFYLTTTNHINDEEGDIIIEEDCWIGAGCILLPKCHIGRGAVVGAGSVVKKEVPPYAVVVGTPAKVIATKFTKEEILRHEAILYPPEERLSEEYLNHLFADIYCDIGSIGSGILNEDERPVLESIKNKLGMVDYSNL